MQLRKASPLPMPARHSAQQVGGNRPLTTDLSAEAQNAKEEDFGEVSLAAGKFRALPFPLSWQ